MSIKKKSVIKSILSLSFLGLLAKVFGLVREGVFAAYFGTSAQMDLFGLLTGYVTTAIAILAMSLGAAYSPTYVKTLQQNGEQEASHRFSNLLNQFILFSIVVYIIVLIALPVFADSVCKRLNGIGREEVLLFSRLIFLTIITGGGTRLLVVALNGLRKYGWMQITQLLYAIIAIVLTVLFGKRFGIIVIVLSFLLNSIIQIVLLWIVYYNNDRHYTLGIVVTEADTVDAWKALIPVFLGTETYLFGLSIDRTVGLSLGVEGTVAALNYSGVLFGMINTLITSPINTVLLVEMYRRYYKSGDRDVLYNDLQSNMNHLAAVLIPIALFLCVTSNDFITIVLKRGAFDEQSALITSSAFFMYALASPFYAFRNMFSGVHRAMRDNRTPMCSGILFLLLDFVLAKALSRSLGIVGITAGSFIAMGVSFFFQYILIKKKHSFKGTLFNRTTLKVIVSSIISVLLVFLISKSGFFSNVFVRFIIEGAVFLSVYALLLYLTKCEEVKELKKQLLKK